MKKVLLTTLLFLTVGFASDAVAQRVSRLTFGTGGFISSEKVTNADGKMVPRFGGIWGQPMVGAYDAKSVTGDNYKVYLGFWTPAVDGSSIKDVTTGEVAISNYPNPVTSATTFVFNLNEPALITLNVYNTLGINVANVCSNVLLQPGMNNIPWTLPTDASIGAGAYSYELQATPVSGKTTKVNSLRGMMMISK
jgi:hypothetical protein